MNHSTFTQHSLCMVWGCLMIPTVGLGRTMICNYNYYNYFINYLINPYLLSSKNSLFIEVCGKTTAGHATRLHHVRISEKLSDQVFLPRNLILLNVCIRFESFAVGRGGDGASRHFAIKYRKALALCRIKFSCQ